MPATRDQTLAGKIVLGIDPGLNTTGYGVVVIRTTRPELVEAGVVRSRKADSLEQRIRSIYEGIAEIIESTKPAEVAIEELYTHYDRPSTAILMGHARGVMMLAAAQAGLPVSSWRPTQVKKVLTGNGRAPKSQVQAAVTQFLQLQKIPDPPDVADALAVAICHCYLNTNRLELT